MEPKRAKTLTPSQIRHLLRVTDATSRHSERDTLVLLLGFTCGMRVSEIAQLEVADVLLPSGRLRVEVSLRGAITKGSKARCVYLSHPKTVAALERYIEWRWKRGKATALDRSKWQGAAHLDAQGHTLRAEREASCQLRRRNGRISRGRQPSELCDRAVPRRWFRSGVFKPLRSPDLRESACCTGPLD